MAVDKLVDSTQLDADLTSVANAIRTKGGTSASLLFPSEFVSAIQAIPTGGGGSLKYEIGTFTLASQTNGNPAVAISHNLGVAPKVVVIWTEEYSAESPPSAALNYGYIYLADIIDLPQRISSSARSNYPFFCWMWLDTTPQIGGTLPSSTSYMPSSSTKPTASNFYLIRRGNSNYWLAGITYKYFVSEAWWS